MGWYNHYHRAKLNYFGVKNDKELLKSIDAYAGSESGTMHVAVGQIWSLVEGTARWAWNGFK